MVKSTHLLLVAALATSPLAARELVNKFVARVNGVNITHRALGQPHITKNGTSLSLDEYIAQELWVQRAQDRKILPMDEDIERNIAAFKEDNGLANLSTEKANEKLKEVTGLTFEQYRNQLWRHFAAEQLKGIEMRNRASVSEVEVRTYYDSHPERVPAEYQVEVAYLTDEKCENWSQIQKNADALQWKKLGWLKHNAIAQHMRVIYTLDIGQFSNPVHIGKQALVVRLSDKKEAHTKSFTERYHDIEMKLQRQKVEQHARNMEQMLLKDSVIIRL